MGNNIITNYPITDYKDIGVKYKAIQEVADMLGISQSYISRLEKKIINKMKKDIMSKTG